MNGVAKRIAIPTVILLITVSPTQQAGSEPLSIEGLDFTEDFLGIAPPSRFSFSITKGGSISISASPSVGGWLELKASGPGEEATRLRLGEDQDDSHYDALNFSNRHGASAATRVMLPDTEGFKATIGWISVNDPDNVGGAVLYRDTKYVSGFCATGALRYCVSPEVRKKACGKPTGQWFLQTVANRQACDTPTNWRHEPGKSHVISITTSCKEVIAYADGQPMARIVQRIPDKPMASEWQIWNHKKDRAQMFVDAVRVKQSRLPAK